jgi:hypothetical protein
MGHKADFEQIDIEQFASGFAVPRGAGAKAKTQSVHLPLREQLCRAALRLVDTRLL